MLFWGLLWWSFTEFEPMGQRTLAKFPPKIPIFSHSHQIKYHWFGSKNTWVTVGLAPYLLPLKGMPGSLQRSVVYQIWTVHRNYEKSKKAKLWKTGFGFKASSYNLMQQIQKYNTFYFKLPFSPTWINLSKSSLHHFWLSWTDPSHICRSTF